MRIPFLAALLIAVPTSAFAQLPTAGEAMGKTSTSGTTAAVTEYDFETDQVSGDPIRPLEENINGRTHAKTPSLLRVRANFVDELVKSVEDL